MLPAAEKPVSSAVVWLRALFFFVQLPVWSVAIFRFFNEGYLDTLTEMVEDSPLLEVLLFAGLATVPYGLCHLRLLANSVELLIVQVAWVLARLRGEFSVTAHMVRRAKAPISRCTQNALMFISTNLFVNAVPDGFEIEVPRLLRFLDLKRDGILEAEEIEDWVYSVTFRILAALLTTHGIWYLNCLKRPPEGWDPDISRQKPRENWVERYWRLTAGESGWWIILDKCVTGCLMLSIGWCWLQALGISTGTIVTVGGGSGLAIGLAAQQVLGNGGDLPVVGDSIATLILLATNPCRKGDFVEAGVPDLRYTGTIEDIGWNATALIQEDGAKVYVPNGTLLSEPLKVIKTARRKRRRSRTSREGAPRNGVSWKGWRRRTSGRSLARPPG